MYASENFWNLEVKIEYLRWNVLIYKDKNKRVVISFHHVHLV